MSGGSYDYACFAIQNASDTLRSRHPNEPHILALATTLTNLGIVMQDIEWADSGDTSWDDDLHAKIRAVIAPASELSVAASHAERAANNLLRALTELRSGRRGGGGGAGEENLR